MTAATLDQIKVSLAYRNLTEALDIVFGEGNWEPDEIGPYANADDFYMMTNINGCRHCAFFSVGCTYTGHDGIGPGGLIGIQVEGDEKSISTFRDGQPLEAVEHLVGTAEEQKSFAWGASGKNVGRIVEYLHILKRYLDQKDESSSAGPSDSSTLATDSDA